MKKKSFFVMLLFVFFFSCKKEEMAVIPSANLESQSFVTLKINSDLPKKALALPDPTSAKLRVQTNDGTIRMYETSDVSLNRLGFAVPAGTYKVVGLDVYSKSKHLLYLKGDNTYLDFKKNEVEGSGGLQENGGAELSVVIESVPFDWEAATYVSNDNRLPRLPWISGASTGVPRGIALDHKREDGWELMHNSFRLINGNDEPRRKYLLFYNKYTGMLRMWYWHEYDGASSLSYSIQHLCNSSMLNFSGDFAQPMDVRSPSYATFVSGDKRIEASLGLAKNTWYLLEYEIAYDDQISGTPRSKSDLFFSVQGIDITTIELQGTQKGTISGQIVMKSPGDVNLFNLGKLDYSTTSTEAAKSASVQTREPESWWSGLLSKISKEAANKIASSVGTAGADLTTKALNLVVSPVGNFLNSLVHQGLENHGTVKLAVLTDIELEGRLSEKVPVTNINLHIPGISEGTGLNYLFDEPLGVFNLSTTPTVEYQQTYYCPNSLSSSQWLYFQYFSLKRSSFQFIINPTIAQSITILEEKTTLYFYKRYQGATKLVPLTALGEAYCSSDGLVYATAPNLENPPGTAYMPIPYDHGFEFYKIQEGAIPPLASKSFGLQWKASHIPASYFQYSAKLQPDKRIVVKAVLKYRINATGREVTFVKTYIPKYVEKQTLNLKY